jgi:cholesterol transport system auxiliary component
MKQSIQPVIAVLLTALTLTACSPVKIPSYTTYTLTMPAPVTTAANKPATPMTATQTLLVSRPNAAAGFATQKMAYIAQPYQLQYFTKNQWVAGPANMLQPLLVQSLQNTNQFKAVVGSPFAGKTDLRLDTTVVALQQNFITQPNQEELIIDANVVSTSDQRLLAGKRFTITVPVSQRSPYGGVQAANQAISLFLPQLNTFVITAAQNR